MGYARPSLTLWELEASFGVKNLACDGRFRPGYGGTLPRGLVLNYTNPMSILTGYMLRYTGVKTVGLCHSVQVCAPIYCEV